MKRYARKPAALTLLAFAAACGATFIHGQSRAGDQNAAEQALSPDDARTNYRELAANCLHDLQSDPYNREIRLRAGSFLALAGDPDPFYSFVRDLVYSDARLAVDLLDRAECRTYLTQPRFVALQAEARAQSMD